MKKCPWCNSNAVLRESPLGFFVECDENGHVHNIGCFENTKSFHKTEDEAEKEWDTAVEHFNK